MKTACIFCDNPDVWDMGIEVDIDIREWSHTARREYRCEKCGGIWQKNGHVNIQWDHEIQINKQPSEATNER